MTTLYNRNLDDIVTNFRDKHHDRLPAREILVNVIDWFEDTQPEIAAEAEAILECFGYYSLEQQMDVVEAFVTEYGIKVI